MVVESKSLNLTLEEALGLFVLEKYERCIDVIKYYSEQGDARAEAKLGLAFQLGLGVAIDFNKAVKYLTKAANQGSGEAAHNLGTLYTTMPENDIEKAKYWFNEARSLGFNPGTDT